MPTSTRDQRMSTGYWRERARRGRDCLFPDGAAVEFVLHESTAPAVIAAVQRADVAACVVPGEIPDIAVIGEVVVLSPWVVWRRLAELGYDLSMPQPKRGPPRKHKSGMKLPVPK